jgi:uncharacterized protein YoxC
MTIDERIEKLTDRHEALAPSVELLTLDLRRQEANIAQLVKSVHAVSKTVDAVSKTVDVLARSVVDLVGIVRSHEGRLARLEGS